MEERKNSSPPDLMLSLLWFGISSFINSCRRGTTGQIDDEKNPDLP